VAKRRVVRSWNSRRNSKEPDRKETGEGTQSRKAPRVQAIKRMPQTKKGKKLDTGEKRKKEGAKRLRSVREAVCHQGRKEEIKKKKEAKFGKKNPR